MFVFHPSVDVFDTNPPVFSDCPVDRTSNVPFGTTSLIVFWMEPTATDDSGQVPNVIASHQSGDAFPVGPMVVSYTATDQAGNQAACTFTITIG